MKITPIQIIGTQRSGSNLLRLMLNQLGDISAPHPPHILKTFAPLQLLYGDLKIDSNFKQMINDVCDFVEANPVEWEGLSLDRHLIFKQSKKRNIYELFDAIYTTYARSQNCTHWCCKSMANVTFEKQLEINGIKPLYIHLYRDGRDVALSFKKVLVGEKHMYHLAKKWSDDQENSLKLFEKLGSGRVIQIAYEDLLEDPENQMRRICSFLNIDFSSNIFNFHRSRESKITAQSGEMWTNVKRPIIKDNHGKFLSELTQEEILLFESKAGQTLDKLGYTIRYGYNGYVMNFDNKKINEYDHQNELLKVDAKKHASQHDINQRSAQDHILKMINTKLKIG